MPYAIHFNFQQAKGDASQKVIHDAGGTDYYSLNLIENVVAGQILARVCEIEENCEDPAIEHIKSPNVLPLFVGENTEVDEKKPSQIIAKVSGQATYENNVISVQPIYEKNGDVDFSTGNLTFVGHLVVHGSVMHGFSVLAGDVTVFGCIDDSNVRSGNQVMMQGDILGSKSLIEAGGSVTAKSMDAGTISARGNIFIATSCFNGRIRSGGSVVVRDPGIISGGKVCCKNSLYARNIGTNWKTPTEIRLGDDPFLLERIGEVNKMVQTLQHRQASLSKGVISGMGNENMDTNQLAEEKKLVETSLLRFRLFEKQMQKRLEEGRKEGRNIALYVLDEVKPGTKISIFNAKLYVKETMKQVYFYYDHGEIKTGKCQQSMESLLRR